MLFLNKSSNILNLTGGEAVSASGIGRVSFVWYVCGCGANSNRDVVGRSFGCWLCERYCFGVFASIFVESLRTPVTMLRLLIGVF